MSTGNTNTERQQAAQRRAEELSGILLLRADGKSLREIASALTAARVPTANGGLWSAQQVQRILLRLGHRPASSSASRDPLSALGLPEQPAPAPDIDPLAAFPPPMI